MKLSSISLSSIEIRSVMRIMAGSRESCDELIAGTRVDAGRGRNEAGDGIGSARAAMRAASGLGPGRGGAPHRAEAIDFASEKKGGVLQEMGAP
jgi:hypothetical protein